MKYFWAQEILSFIPLSIHDGGLTFLPLQKKLSFNGLRALLILIKKQKKTMKDYSFSFLGLNQRDSSPKNDLLIQVLI